MPKRYVRKLAVLAKIETVYATDAAPTGAANAIQMTDVTLTPFAGTEETRDLMLPYLGNQGVELVGNYVTLAGSVEMAGANAAGTVPAYGPLLRMCGMSEVVLATTSVTYAPVSTGFEAGSVYYNLDGVKHVMLGARGTLKLDLAPSKIPRFQFTLTGLLGTISDGALPTVDLTKFIRPMVVSKANTTMSLHGVASIAEALSIDLGNQIEPRFLIGDESIELVDRQSSGSVTLEASTLAAKDWFAAALARTRGVLSVVHGVGAGKIVEIAAPAVELDRPTQGASQKIANYTIPLMLCPVTGNDELKFIVR